jgi:hypothetical protein
VLRDKPLGPKKIRDADVAGSPCLQLEGPLEYPRRRLNLLG